MNKLKTLVAGSILSTSEFKKRKVIKKKKNTLKFSQLLPHRCGFVGVITILMGTDPAVCLSRGIKV